MSELSIYSLHWRRVLFYHSSIYSKSFLSSWNWSFKVSTVYLPCRWRHICWSAAASHMQDVICNLCNGVCWPFRSEIRGRGIEWRRDSQDDNKLVRLVMKAKSGRNFNWSNILLMGWVSSEHKSDHWIKGINGQACQSCHSQSYCACEEDGSFNEVNWWEETTWGEVEQRIKIWRPVWGHGRTNDTFLRSCLWLQTKPNMGVYIQLANKAQPDDWPWEKWDQHDA